MCLINIKQLWWFFASGFVGSLYRVISVQFIFRLTFPPCLPPSFPLYLICTTRLHYFYREQYILFFSFFALLSSPSALFLISLFRSRFDGSQKIAGYFVQLISPFRFHSILASHFWQLFRIQVFVLHSPILPLPLFLSSLLPFLLLSLQPNVTHHSCALHSPSQISSFSPFPFSLTSFPSCVASLSFPLAVHFSFPFKFNFPYQFIARRSFSMFVFQIQFFASAQSCCAFHQLISLHSTH